MGEYRWFKDPVTGRETYRRVKPLGTHAAGNKSVHFVRDDCDVVSMVDGQRYTSKAALRRSYRRHGYIEAGGEPIESFQYKPPEKDRRRLEDTVSRALTRAGLTPDR